MIITVFLSAYWSSVINIEERAEIKSLNQYFVYTYKEGTNNAAYYTNTNMRIGDASESSGIWFESSEDNKDIYVSYRFRDNDFNNIFMITYLDIYFQGTAKTIELTYSNYFSRPVSVSTIFSLNSTKLRISTQETQFTQVQKMSNVEFKTLSAFLDYSYSTNQCWLISCNAKNYPRVHRIRLGI